MFCFSYPESQEPISNPLALFERRDTLINAMVDAGRVDAGTRMTVTLTAPSYAYRYRTIH